ncbi:unnamed protein product [Dibothriocephalus latus]|uniref:Uncharacterized protein n=1 Tax=Dibothriocephalus latus TaxID=60516 RepID=A0A3P6VA47_DIBLA|nr:unnamed protein product [Dibothriocephalus latus]
MRCLCLCLLSSLIYLELADGMRIRPTEAERLETWLAELPLATAIAKRLQRLPLHDTDLDISPLMGYYDMDKRKLVPYSGGIFGRK